MHESCRRATARAKASVAVVLLACVAAACSDKADDKKPATQVAAKVNAGEISVHQINFLFQRTPGVTPETADEVKHQILNGLVDQELAVQQALEAKLDRDPMVMQTLETARREILARAYLDRVAAGKGAPSEEEVRTYYREHPELFAERKVYKLQEIAIPAAPEAIATVREQLARSRSGEELLNALRARGINVTGAVMVRPAESIAMEMLPRLVQMKAGQSAIFENGQHASLVTLLDSSSQPLSEEAAKPAIRQFLSRRQSNDLAKAALQELRDKARIEYVGEFGKAAEEARKARIAAEDRKAREIEEARNTARLAQEAESAKRAEEMKKAREAADAARTQSARLPAASDSTINKGIAGLK